MIAFIIRLLANALVIFLLARYLPGFTVNDYSTAILFAILLGLVNAVIRPVISLIALPITILTLGLFTLIINAVLFWLVAGIVDGVDVASFSTAFIAALILSLISGLLSFFLKK